MKALAACGGLLPVAAATTSLEEGGREGTKLLPVAEATPSLGEGGRGGKYRMKEQRREQG